MTAETIESRRPEAGRRRAETASRTRVRRHPLVPDAPTWVDLAAVLLLGGLALAAFATSYSDLSFLAVGLVGLVAAVLVTHVVRAFEWPLVAAVVILLPVFFLLGGPLCLRSAGAEAMVPSGSTFARLADLAVFGWKELLTTLPPVDGDGPLLVLPWLLGLVIGVVGTSAAGVRSRRPWLTAAVPVVVMVALLVGVILLGVRQPQSLLLQGAAYAAVALLWLSLRVRRESVTVQGGDPARTRILGAAVLVALASGLALPVSSWLVGDDDTGRVVARSWVEPPFDIGQYASPLAGFRKYVDRQGLPRDETNVHDEELFTISGVEAGTRVRFATLDRYDGMVWGATNDPIPGEGGDSFQRVSTTINNPVEGRHVEGQVTIGEGYDGVWLPVVGALQRLEFDTGDPVTKSETFRYNLATSTAVVPSGLRRGDTYSFAAVIPDDSLDASVLAAAQSQPPPTGTEFMQGPAQKWPGNATSPMERVLAAAEHLRTEGRYSDGIGRTQRGYHPGHNLRRLGDEFVNAPQMVGNDEQYAAVMGLLANQIGVPARVVMGATVPEGGVVMGKDVSAWIEVRAADGTWRTLPTEEFMGDKPPAEQLPQTNSPMSGTVVPPPNPVPPPSDAGEQTDADLKERRTKEAAEDEDDPVAGLPAWVWTVLRYVGLPLLLVAAVLGSIVGLKALRRRRRRTAASTSARFVGAWRELVDHARDLGMGVPLGATVTRREQAVGLATDGAGTLARRADSSVFGPQVPPADAAASYWQAVDEERRAMSASVSRRRRVLAAVNLASLRPQGRRVRS